MFYRDASHYFTAQIYAELLQLHNANDIEAKHFFDQLSAFGNFRFMNILHVKQPWEYAIGQLHNILTDHSLFTNQQASISNRRMVWIIDPTSQDIEVAEQSLRKNGTWSAGRSIALKRIYYKDPKLDYLTPYDRAATAGLRRETHEWYNQEEFSWDMQQTLTALIGHPFVFHKSKSRYSD